MVTRLTPPREEGFGGLPIDGRIRIGGGAPSCGVMVVELASGNNTEWLRFRAPQSDLFDIVAKPEILCSSAVAPQSAEADRKLTFDPLPVLAIRALGEMA